MPRARQQERITVGVGQVGEYGNLVWWFLDDPFLSQFAYYLFFKTFKQVFHEFCPGFTAVFSGKDSVECVHSIITETWKAT